MMRILFEMDRQPNVPHLGRLLNREAVRAVILKGRKILLAYSQVHGDYKLPGGRIDLGECPESALARELAEEIGGRMTSTAEPYGKTLEYDLPIEKEYDAFCVTSYYYCCEVDAILGKQHLDDYEARMGLKPVWVDIDTAIAGNRAILTTGGEVFCWIKRETRVLEMVRDELIR